MIERDTICYWGHLKVQVVRELKLKNYVNVKLLEVYAACDNIIVDMETLSIEKRCEYAISLKYLGGEYD